VSGQPTLLFCVGATKAGTTWLYRHLAAHPDCQVRAIKELHYFDTVESESWTRRLRLHRAWKARLDARQQSAAFRDVRDWIDVLKRRAEDLPAYVSYVTGGADGRRLVADITPSYSGLPVSRLAQMSRLLPDVRFLYLLRDPVSRFWSHVRMLALRQVGKPAEVPDKAREIMAEVLAGRSTAAVERGDYAANVPRLQAAVTPDKLCLMVQEEMMTDAGIRGLWAFLGIGAAKADFARRAHEGVPVPLTGEERRVLRRWLQPQYDFVEETLGRLPKAWQHPAAGEAA
jgi:Sulfotransferase family